MSSFSDQNAAASNISRIEARVHRPVGSLVESLFVDIPSADAGLVRLSRLLDAQAQPSTTIAQIEAAPQCGRLLARLLAMSHQLGDVLVQNPELSDVVLSPEALTQNFTLEALLAEGRHLLSLTSSYTHQLDRLRFLKQKSLLQTAALDLGDVLPQHEIWRRITLLAEATLILILESAWNHFRARHGGPEACPLAVLGMGKFGGQELNYSSDIDIVFVAEDDLPKDQEDKTRKFAELVRAGLADRMGRGDLYRTDLRLRPFGSQGPIFSRIKALEAYYQRYSEPWEHLAMIRSKLIGASPEVNDRWQKLRDQTVFQKSRGSWVLETLAEMRRRTEDLGGASDLKRGSGGIRDVEFLVQTLQMIHGAKHPTVKGAGTLGMIQALDSENLLPAGSAHELAEGYTFLRRLEHRCQIVGGLQTHTLPTEDIALSSIASSMDFSTVHALQSTLQHHREKIRHWYNLAFNPSESDLKAADDSEPWQILLSGNEHLIQAARANATSIQRLEKIWREAPALVPEVKNSITLAEQVLSGEIEEPFDPTARLKGLSYASDPATLAIAVKTGWNRACLGWILSEGESLATLLTGQTDAFVLATLAQIPSVQAVYALGSYASGELAPTSDADILVFTEDLDNRTQAESDLQAFLKTLAKAKTVGLPVDLDFRLRPEGRTGRLAVSLNQFRKYEAESMETWERFALGRSRAIVDNNPEIGQAMNFAAFGRPLDDSGLIDLIKMKRRIEGERVSPKMRTRHLKLGNGGLDDIVWLVQLWMMRHPFLHQDSPSVTTPGRIQTVVNAQILTVVEGELLVHAHKFLSELRARLYLLGSGDDVFPENPDKLETLSSAMQINGANALLKQFIETTTAVRSIFEDGLKRMSA